MYPEGLPLGHATPPAGNEETGPVKGGGEVSRGLKEGGRWREAVRSFGFEKGKHPGGDVQERASFQLFPGWQGQ